MRVDLPLGGYAAAGGGVDALAPERVVALPRPGPARSGGRLPRLALALAERAAGEEGLPEDGGVLIGSALGCLSETEQFVAHMIRAREATPKPRAFSASVHNAIASFVALSLGLHGECQTFVHGELSFAHALFAAARARGRSGGTSPLLVGAVDERPAGTFRELAEAAGIATAGEGGAVLLVPGGGDRDAAPARVGELWLGRAADPHGWMRARLTGSGVQAVLSVGATRAGDADLEGEGGLAVLPIPALHPSSLATATAIALGLLRGEVVPAPWERPALGEGNARPTTLAVLGSSGPGSDEVALFTLVATGAG